VKRNIKARFQVAFVARRREVLLLKFNFSPLLMSPSQARTHMEEEEAPPIQIALIMTFQYLSGADRKAQRYAHSPARSLSWVRIPTLL